MSKLTILPLCISCKKYEERWPRMREMFRRQKIENYFIVYGDPSLEQDYCLKGDVLAVKAGDYYEDLTEKVVSVFSLVAKEKFFLKYTGVVKIDDDIGLKNGPWSLKDLLLRWQNSGIDYCGKVVHAEYGINSPVPVDQLWHQGKCNNAALNSQPYHSASARPWCIGGLPYYLSRKAIELIQVYMANKEQRQQLLARELYEDVAIAKLMHHHGVFQFHDPMVLDVVQLEAVKREV